ncbi:hypothetical protein FXO38_24124 [Capsicum annuum]|nr:hypothetical protein FXO38_24124 [Capsicum annuum]
MVYTFTLIFNLQYRISSRCLPGIRPFTINPPGMHQRESDDQSNDAMYGHIVLRLIFVSTRLDAIQQSCSQVSILHNGLASRIKIIAFRASIKKSAALMHLRMDLVEHYRQ